MSWKRTNIENNPVYITSIGESSDKSRLFIEVLSDPTTYIGVSDNAVSTVDHRRVYELYRYGKTATASETTTYQPFRLGTTPIYEEGAMWIED